MIEEVVYATLRSELKEERFSENKIEKIVSDFPMSYLLEQFWEMYDEQLNGTIERYYKN